MFSKNCFSLLIVTFLVSGLIFFAFTENGFSLLNGEIGCCTEAGSSTSCVPGQSSPNVFDNQEGCEQSASGRMWIVDEICQTGGGPPMCVPALGCCVNEPGMCSTTTQSECPVPPNESWNLGISCDELEICDPPTGCCETDDQGLSCSEGITQADCVAMTGFVAWNQDTPCIGNVCAGAPVGCCSGINDPMSCQDSVTEDECISLQGTWSEGETCNTEDTCGQLGCCQIQEEEQCLLTIDGTPACSLTNKADCSDGLWIADDICTESGLCASLITGCCVFGENDCFETTQGECMDQGGEYRGDFVECSEVPICNVIPSQVPTLSQWGLIAMAGLLGLFSLFIIARRQRYNLS